MEIKSYGLFVEKLIVENSELDAFSPDNSGELANLFKKAFYLDTPFWRQAKWHDDKFYIEFKKYGENRRRIFLKFSFLPNTKSPRYLEFSIADENFKELKDTLINAELSAIWQDHSVLTTLLKNFVKQGLELAAKVN